MDLAVFDSSGKQVKKVTASDLIFEQPVNPSSVHAVVRWQRAKRRAGTHSTLTRTIMEGGGRKPFKQKGTGRARAGSNISPLWVGGAVIFGPQPRDYTFKLPRKVRRQALLSVLSERAANGAITVVDRVNFESPKTKEFRKLLSSLELENPKEKESKGSVLFLFSEGEEAAAVSARNLPAVRCLAVEGVNVYDLLRSERLLMSETTFTKLQARLLGEDQASE